MPRPVSRRQSLEVVIRGSMESRVKGDFVKAFFIRLARDEQGQDLVEYALIVAAGGSL
jgi:hypothetical protein